MFAAQGPQSRASTGGLHWYGLVRRELVLGEAPEVLCKSDSALEVDGARL